MDSLKDIKKEEKRKREGMVENLEQDKSDLMIKENDLDDKILNVSSIEKEVFLKNEIRKKIQEEKEEVSKKIDEKRKFQSELEKTNLVIRNKEDSIFTNNKLINELKKQIQELESISFNESDIKKFESEKISFRKDKEGFNEENIKISSQLSALKLKNDDNNILWKQISKIDICPTCLQDVDPVYKTNVSNKLEENTTENIKKIKELEEQKLEVIKKYRFIEY